MGIVVISYTIKEISDDVGYLKVTTTTTSTSTTTTTATTIKPAPSKKLTNQ
jgi:hypothetical protein